MPELATNAATMPRSGIRRVMDAAWSLPGPIIGLHVGEPSFDAPTHVLDAARRAYASGDTHYVPNAGIPALRAAIACKLLQRNGLQVAPSQVVVSAGGAQALHLALSLVVGHGDEVLVPDPGWPNFAMGVQLLQATPVRYPLRPENGFRPNAAELSGLVTNRTRAIIVNTPSNPLGTVLPAEEVEALVRLADRHDMWLVSDECYDGLTFGVEHVSPARFDKAGRVLSCFSFSKTYAMTGLRVGYLVAPETVAATAAKLQEPMIACVNAPAQAAALAALTGPQDEAQSMLETYQERRDAAVSQLTAAGRPHVHPEGAFYLWLDVRNLCDGDVDTWAMDLLHMRGVALAPGTTFGSHGEGWARVSLAADTHSLLTGLAGLEAHL